jgi:hypothetical protein
LKDVIQAHEPVNKSSKMIPEPQNMARQSTDASHKSSSIGRESRNIPPFIESDECEVQAEAVLKGNNRYFYVSPPDTANRTDKDLLDIMEAKINLFLVMVQEPGFVDELLQQPRWRYPEATLAHLDARLRPGIDFNRACEILLKQISRHGYIMGMFYVVPWATIATTDTNQGAREASGEEKVDILLAILGSLVTTRKTITHEQLIVKEQPEYMKALREFDDKMTRRQLQRGRRVVEQGENGNPGFGRHQAPREKKLALQKTKVYLPRWPGCWEYRRSVDEDRWLMFRMRSQEYRDKHARRDPGLANVNNSTQMLTSLQGEAGQLTESLPTSRIQEVMVVGVAEEHRLGCSSATFSQMVAQEILPSRRENTDGSETIKRGHALSPWEGLESSELYRTDSEGPNQVSREQPSKAAQAFQNADHTKPRLDKAKKTW